MLVSKEVSTKRKEVCYSCEYKRNDFKLFNIIIFKREPQCKLCKCFIDKKVLFDFAECPDNRWEK